jgi:hypothetical protein
MGGVKQEKAKGALFFMLSWCFPYKSGCLTSNTVTSSALECFKTWVVEQISHQ